MIAENFTLRGYCVFSESVWFASTTVYFGTQV